MKPREEPLSIDWLLEHSAIDSKTLHERAAELTRRNILLAAMQCFAEKGYQAATIREIAAHAGVTLGAVYHHFKGKKALLMSMNRSRQIASLQVTRAAMAEGEDFFDGLREALRGQFKLLADDPILRGVFREYMGMAMVDPDVNRMHSQNDLEFREVFSGELERRCPKLSESRRDTLVQMLLVSFQGLITHLVVGSPVVGQPEVAVDALVDTFRYAVERWDAEKLE